MWLTFALLILAATLIVIFADEVIGILKEYWQIGWFKLLVPLLVASYLFLEFELFIIWIFNQIKLLYFNIVGYCMTLLPHSKWALITTQSLIMFLIVMTPVIAVDRWILHRHKTKRLENRYFISLIIWLVLGIIFVAGTVFD